MGAVATTKQVDDLCDLIRQGNSVGRAANLVGLDPAVVGRWRFDSDAGRLIKAACQDRKRDRPRGWS